MPGIVLAVIYMPLVIARALVPVAIRSPSRLYGGFFIVCFSFLCYTGENKRKEVLLMELIHGRPETNDGRLPKEIRVYDFLDDLNIDYY